MELSESVSTRGPDLLGDLRSAADNLKSCSSPDVQNEIETTVEESVVQWNDSRQSLRNLCDRYQNAIKIWTAYRKNSDIVNEWVDNQLSSLSTLPAEEAVQQLQIYEEAVNEQSEKLVELRGMVMEIATEVGVKEDNLIADEIALLSRKLEDVRSTISSFHNVTVFEKRKVVNGELAETEKTLESMKQDLSSTSDGNSTLNAEHIQKLNDHLRALAQTDTILNNIKEGQAEILADPDAASNKPKISVVNLLESWQQVFKETFQRYHGLFTSVSGEQNYLEALKLWTDYLHYVQDFLASAIPDNYHNLSSDDQICQLYENLLLSQSAILLDDETKGIRSSLSEQFESLNKLHNETLSSVISRHHQVKQKLLLWQRYQKDHRELLSFLRSIESEQSHLNLRDIYIRNIDFSLRKIDDLLKKIERGISMADNLRDQHDTLMSGCSQSVISSVKVELDSNYKRLHNSEAALKTWHEYLFKIKNVTKLYEDIASNIEQIFIKIHEGIDSEVCPVKETTYAIADIKQKMDKLMKFQEEIKSLDKEVDELSNLEEKLKQSVNTKDMKVVRQRIWLLKQQQKDINYQLSVLIFQLEEKLTLWDTFNNRQQSFMTWANDLNISLEKFSRNQDYPEVILRRLENEFCTEVDSKHGEYNWLLSTSECLSKYESDSETEPIGGKINNVMDVWKQVNDDTKGEVEKVKHIIKESATLRTNIKDIIVWIRELSFTLNTIIFFERFDESALNEKIQEHEALQKEIDQREKEISDVLQRCEIFVMDCEHCNVSLDIKSFIVRYDSLDRNWSSLKMECAQSKDRIFVVWKMIQEVLSLCQSEDPWLTEQHELLTKIQSQCDIVPFSDINALGLKLNTISVAINNHSTQFKLLEESYADLLSKNHIRNLSLVQETLDRYSALKKFVVRLNGRIDDDLSKWKEFLSSHGNLILQLSQTDAKLTQIQHLDDANVGNAEDANKIKLEKLLALESEFESLNESVTASNNMAAELMSNKNRPDGKNVQEMMDEYLVMYKDIKKRIKTLKQFYRKNKSIKSQPNVSEEVQVETLKFEQDFAAQVDTLPTSLERKDAFHYELQSTKKESQDNIERLIELSNENPNSEETTKAIACCQSSVDLMKHLSAVLISQCGMLSDEAVLVEVDELVNKYQSLLSDIRFKQQHYQQQQTENNSELGRLRCPLCSQRNWSQLDNDIWRLEKWLEHAQSTLQANPVTPPQNIEQLEDVIQEHKEFMVYLDSHRDVIVSLNIVGKHLMEHSENEHQSVVLQDRLVRVNEKWEKVCTQSLVWQHKLQAALMENEEFHNIIEELLKWIEETENSIKSCEPVDLTEDTSVIKEKYNKFKKLHKSLKRCEPRVASLQAANQVCITQQTNELETSQNKLDHLRLRLQSLIRLTWLYMLKLGSVLGYDVRNLHSGMDLSTTSTMTLSQEFLDEYAIEPMDRADTPESTTSNEDENRSILSRGNRFFGRVIRASLPIQAFIFVMLGVVTLFPRVDDEYTCSTSNNMAWSLEPMLRYPDGPPPT